MTKTVDGILIYTDEQRDAHLARIGLNMKKLSQDPVTALGQLMKAQLSSVPFENFDVILGRQSEPFEEIQLDAEAFYKKIVEDNRGGFCFEQQATFIALLR